MGVKMFVLTFINFISPHYRPEGDCAYNIWDARMGVYLTSGFRHDQDVSKPESKSKGNIQLTCSGV